MSRRIRFMQLAIVIAFSVALGLSGSAAAQGGTTVAVAPASTSLAVGQTGTVSINVANVSNLSAFEVHLSFNPAVVEVVQIANGGFVAPDFVAQNTFNNAAGTIDYAIAQMNRAPVSGSGTLLAITLRGKASGTSPLAFSPVAAAPGGVILSDPNGAAIPASLLPGQIVVGGGGTTPPPAATTPPPAATTPPPAATTPPPAATTPPPVATQGPYPILGYHVVKQGESLYCIGRAYKVSPWAIGSVNNVPWPYYLYPGQTLAIPNAPWYNIPPGPTCAPQFGTGPQPTPTPGPPQPATPTPVPGVTPTPKPPQQCRYYHYVLPGQTLYGISLYYGVPMYTIQQANGIVNPNLIYAYTYLCIP
jgi:LysM repeat protein